MYLMLTYRSCRCLHDLATRRRLLVAEFERPYTSRGLTPTRYRGRSHFRLGTWEFGHVTRIGALRWKPIDAGVRRREPDYFALRRSRRICSSASITSSRVTRLRAKLSFRLNCLFDGRNAKT